MAKKNSEKEELSILDIARHEKNMTPREFAKPEGKKYTREVFKMWMALPDQFKGMPERITSILGITDTVTLELLKIPTMQAFADEFGVQPAALSRWRKDIEEGDEFLQDVKKSMRSWTKNFMAALYRKGIEEGDAARFKIWMQVIEDWREQLGIDHSGSVSKISDEEKRALDRMLKKNTKS